jgi:uncharacterized membrane protein YidH (DUF202 family)
MHERGRGGGEGVRTRDHLANVRTTLAWVRTGVVLMGVGYGLDKLAAVDRLHGVHSVLTLSGRPLGLASVIGGVGLSVASLPRFLLGRARIESDRLEPGFRLPSDLLLIVVLAAGGLGLLVVLTVAR